MGTADYLEFGLWNVICDRCGVKRKNNQVKKEWTGLIVCADKCWEPRHPQDFVRAKPDDQSVPFVRPEQPDVFVSVTHSCDAEETVWVQAMEVVNQGNKFIGKGYSVGPINIIGTTVTVRCLWTIA